MQIRSFVKTAFAAIIVLLVVMVAINGVMLYKIDEYSISKDRIAKLVNWQEDMNLVVQKTLKARENTELDRLQRRFSGYERAFEDLKNSFIVQDSDDLLDWIITDLHRFPPVRQSLEKLFSHEQIIETYYGRLILLQKEKNTLAREIERIYPEEKALRKAFAARIDATADMEAVKAFARLQYYSKEALYQYRDRAHVDLWLGALQRVQALLPAIDFSAYEQRIARLGNLVIAISGVEKLERRLATKIENVLQQNRQIHMRIQAQTGNLSGRFLNRTFLLIAVLFAVTLLLILWLAYRVSKNVGLSFGQIERRVQRGLAKIKELNKEITDTQKEVVFTMGAIGERRSRETGNHVRRVAEYSRLLAKLHGLPEEEAEMLKQASPMHDIGKIAIPDAVLNKPGKLDKAEWKTMQTHAQLGEDMLRHSKRPLLQTAAIVAGQHHEKYDGSGYPRGLKGEDIHIYGRITAVADVFDALGSDRVYKKAWEDEKIFALFKQERGKHFDPRLIDLFFANLDRFMSIRRRFNDR